MLYCTGFRGSRHYAPKVLDEEEDDFFITVLFQLYYNYKMTIIIILLLVYYVGVFVLFIIYYKRSALTHCGLLSTCDLRLSVIGIDGCTLGMYHTHSLSLPSTDRHRWGYCWDVPQSTLYLHVQQTYLKK